MKQINIAIMENETDISTKIEKELSSDARFDVVFNSCSTKEILSMIKISPTALGADVIIVSYELKNNGAVKLIDALAAVPFSERPYLIVTSHICNNVIIGYLSSIGACDFVHKPYEIGEMISRLSYLYAYLNNLYPTSRFEKYSSTYSNKLREPDRLSFVREEQRLITGITFELLMDSQIPIKSNGFKYIVQSVAILYYMDKDNFHIMKDIYPKVAAINMVSAEAVERCIRTSVAKGWARCRAINGNDDQKNLFSRYTKKPTNGELITYAAYCVKKIIDNQLNIS